MKTTVPLVLAVLTIALASCGGDEDSTTSTASTEAQAPVTTAPRSPAEEGPSSKPAPGFHQDNGKLDIPAFGVEAGEKQRKQAEAALEGYLQAREDGKWEKACSYLLATTRTQLLLSTEQRYPGKAKSCADALELVYLEYPGQRANLATAGVSSLRVKPGAGAGFALFHGSDGADYWMAMKVEGSSWKVLSASPTDLTASERKP